MKHKRYFLWLGIKGKRNIRAAIWGKFQGQCVYCCRSIGFSSFHIDHHVPISRGGSNSYDNLFPACAPCNLQKSDKTCEEAEMNNHWKLAYFEDGSPRPETLED